MKTILLASILLFTSCGHHRKGNAPRPFHVVEIDSISESNSLKRFKIVSGMSNFKDTDLRFKQLAKMASNALLLDGYILDEKAPEINIVLTFDVSDPDTMTTVKTAPVFGYTSSEISNRYGQTLGNVETFGQTGTRTTSTSTTYYKLKIGLKAVSVKTDAEVWVTNIESIGQTNDLVNVFPYMVFGATGHYGTTSKDRYNVNIGDKRVEALRAPASK